MEQLDRPVDWQKLHAMPSGRLFGLSPGDVLVLPAGTFHYVYTVRKKLVVAGDFCSAWGWRARVASAAEWRENSTRENSTKRDTHSVDLEQIFVRGLLDVELPRANKMLARSQSEAFLPAGQRAYLLEVLVWAEQLKGARAMEREGVQLALSKVRACLDM